MASITVITIVVVAILTVVIATLTWLSYSSCLKTYKTEVAMGLHDSEIREEYRPRGKGPKAWRTAGSVVSCTLIVALLALFSAGVAYRAQGGEISFNGQTALVVKSGSMSGFYDDSLAEEYKELGYDVGLQFDVGDICLFETVSADAGLVRGEVYGYKRKNYIILHRLIGEYAGDLYEFRGDNNSGPDGVLVKRENVAYRYTGKKIPGVGAFVLYAQSYFGLWSLFGIVFVTIGSEAVRVAMTDVELARYHEICPEIGRGKRHED